MKPSPIRIAQLKGTSSVKTIANLKGGIHGPYLVSQVYLETLIRYHTK